MFLKALFLFQQTQFSMDEEAIMSKQKRICMELITAFVRYFVSTFESIFLAYLLILDGVTEKSGEMMDGPIQLSETLLNASGPVIAAIFAAGTGPLAAGVGALLGSFLGLSGPLLSQKGMNDNSADAFALANLIYKFRNSKIQFRRQLVNVGVDMFQSFEMQFMNVYVDGSPEIALRKLAEDAVFRAINYLVMHKDDEELKLIDLKLTECILFGKSKVEPLWGMIQIPIKQPGYQIMFRAEQWNSASLFEKVGLVRGTPATYYVKINGKNRTGKYGYRRPFLTDDWNVEKVKYNIDEQSNDDNRRQFRYYEYMMNASDCAVQEKNIFDNINESDPLLSEDRMTRLIGDVVQYVNELKASFGRQEVNNLDGNRNILAKLSSLTHHLENLNIKDYMEKMLEKLERIEKPEHFEKCEKVEANTSDSVIVDKVKMEELFDMVTSLYQSKNSSENDGKSIEEDSNFIKFKISEELADEQQEKWIKGMQNSQNKSLQLSQRGIMKLFQNYDVIRELQTRDFQVFHLLTTNIDLVRFRIIDAYSKQFKFLYIDKRQKKEVFQEIQKIFIAYDTFSFLFVEYDDFCEDRNFVKEFQSVLAVLSINKKLVLVGRRNHNCVKFLTTDKGQTVEDTSSFRDLPNDVQSKLMEQNIQFQDFEIKLGNLIDLELAHEIIDPNTLWELITNSLSIGSHLTLAKNDSFYISRSFKHRIEINKDILADTTKLSGIIAVSNISDIELKGLTERKFTFSERKLKVEPSSIFISHNALNLKILYNIADERNVHFHWFHYDNGTLIWEETRGETKEICDFIANEKFSQENVPKTNFQNFFNLENLIKSSGKLVVISDVVSIGKSTEMINLALRLKEFDPSLWVLRIDFNQSKTRLLQLRNQNVNTQSLDVIVTFLLDQLTSQYKMSDFDRKLFIRSFDRQNKIALIFDAFDDVCPEYENLVIKLLRTLIEKSNLFKIIVSTRVYMRHALEMELNVFSYTINRFNESEKREVLKKCWENLSEQTDHSHNLLNIFADAVVINFSTDIIPALILQRPLTLYMLADVFMGSESYRLTKIECTCRDFLLEGDPSKPILIKPFHLIDLFDLYVDKQFYRFEWLDQKQSNFSIPSIRIAFDHMYNEFQKKYQLLALSFLLNSIEFNSLTSCTERSNIEMFKQTILQSGEGIVEQIIDNKPIFKHKNFAEYLVAKVFYNWLKDDNRCSRYPVVKILCCKVLLHPSFSVVGKLLNWLLRKNPLPLTAVRLFSHKLSELWLDKADRYEAFDSKGRTAIDICINEKFYRTLSLFIAAFQENPIDLMYFIAKLFTYSGQRSDKIKEEIFCASLSHTSQTHVRLLLAAHSFCNCDIDNVSFNKIRALLSTSELYDSIRTVWDRIQWEVVDRFDGLNAQTLNIENIAAIFGDCNETTQLALTLLTGPLLKAVEYRMSEIGIYLLKLIDRHAINEQICRTTYSSGCLSLVQYLVKTKAYFDPFAMHYAASSQIDDIDVLQWLLNQEGGDIEKNNIQNQTVLQIAVVSGNLNISRFLASNSADLKVLNRFESTLLQMAAENGHSEIVSWLLMEGADVNSTDNNKRTALHVAAFHDHLNVIKILVANGANLDALDVAGKKPHEISFYNYRITYEWFVANGAEDFENEVIRSLGQKN